MASQDHVFNQYYFDLLKKLKSVAKNNKYESHDARVMLRGIKKHYQSWDKLSAEFRRVFKEITDATFADYAALQSDVETLDNWVATHGDMMVYKDIPLKTIASVGKDNLIIHHYLTILSIFKDDMTDENVAAVLDVLRNLADKGVPTKIAAIAEPGIQLQLQRLVDLASVRVDKAIKQPFDAMPDIENTSLGKLAKEILQEVNIDELQTSMGDGDIMKALANPDGGLVKLLGTVSQKMISKMSTGELKQENLLQDAMKLASTIGGKEMGALGNIMNMFGGGDAGGFDLSKMANMMGGGRAPRAREVRRKFAKHGKQTKENIQVTVEDE